MTNIRKLIEGLEEQNSHHKPKWFLDKCFVGDACWCRTISDKEGSDELEDCIAASGTINEKDAELIVMMKNNLPALLEFAKEALLVMQFYKGRDEYANDWKPETMAKRFLEKWSREG